MEGLFFKIKHLLRWPAASPRLGAARWPFLLLAALFFAASCNTTRFLDASKNERLLVKNKVVLHAPKHFKGKTEFVYSLESYFKQQPNTKVLRLFRTRLWFFYKYRNRTSKFAEWVNKRVAEPPTIYDDDLTERTRLNFQNSLRQRGYFNAEVSTKTRFFGKNISGDGLYFNPKTDYPEQDIYAEVTYNLHFGELYTIDTVQFVSRDSALLDILLATTRETNLKRGGAIAQTTFDAEKLRITTELKNRGYAFFIPNFIEFTGDSSGRKADVTVEVLPQNDTTPHQTYRLGKVIVFSSLVPDLASIRSDTTIAGISYFSAEPRFTVRPDRLDAVIFTRPGALYRQEDFDKTYRSLNALGVFRFVTIKQVADSLDPKKLDVTIALSPNERLSIDYNVDLNYSQSVVSSQLLGIAASVSGENRNLVRGGERMSTTLGGNIEFNLKGFNDRPFNSLEVSLGQDLRLPRFNDYLKLWKTTNRLHFGKFKPLPTPLFERMKSEGRARYSLNFSYLDLFDFYSYSLAHGSYGYDVAVGREASWSFDHVAVDVLQPDTSRPKWSELAQNEFLRRSFGNQLFTGFLLRGVKYNYSGNSNRFGERWGFRFGSELSGLEEVAVFKIYSAISGDRVPWKIGTLDFSKYARLDLDGTYTRDFNDKIGAAVRLGAGAILPFGDTKTAPYVKQFFIGGPNSLRAWRVRELGPGSYFDKKRQPDRPPFYQAADFRFEFNAELRFDIFMWFKGAVFLDAGNVWTFKNEDNDPLGRKGSQLRWDSYRNIALGSGFGLRMDFEYFIFRFDVGLKLRRPYLTEGKNYYWVWNRWRDAGLDPLNWNIAVGYPF